MIPVCASASVRALDAAVIADLGVPGRTLMELAGRGAADACAARFPTGDVAVLCGPGNNGGDGFVVARWLALWGRSVRLWAPKQPATADAATNRALCERMGLPFVASPSDLEGAAVYVDALLGTGQKAAPRGFALQGITALRDAAERGAGVVALDLPTGVCADTGRRLGDAVCQSDITVTFGRWKPGLLCHPGAALAGEVVLVDIGLDLARLADRALGTPDGWILEAADVAAWSPALPVGAAKWDRGHVAVRAGGGAGVLAAHGALRAGAGLVTLLVPRADQARLHGLWPAVILADPEALDRGRHDVVVVGPGLGHAAAEEARALWGSFPGAVVAVAAALTALAEAPPTAPADAVRVITPHAAEAARLLGLPRRAVEADRFGAARALREAVPGATAALKGPGTLISGGEATPAPWVCPRGGPRLATAGSGDVLAGMVGALLGQKLGPARAAAVAVWRHGAAGERMPEGGTASDLIALLRGEA